MFREIRRSFGRFLAIFCIVMLGAGFLAGLKVTKSAMLHTLEHDSVNRSLFDFRVLSTLGLTDDDVAAFSALHDIEQAEGSIQADAVFALPSGSEDVLKVYSLPHSLNTLALQSGRLPEHSNECIADAAYMHNLELGDVITLVNTEDTSSDLFTHKEYTVVGLATSPLYINYARGTTSLGNGSVGGFIFVGDGGLHSDYYTDVYLRLANTGFVYSKEYDDAVDKSEDAVTHAANARGDDRYEEVVTQATTQYQDAIQDYEDGLSEYEFQKSEADLALSEALKKTTSAERKLAASRNELNRGWAQLDTGKSQLAAARATYENESSSAQAELSASKQQLDASRAQYDQAYAAYQAGESQYADGLAQYQQGKAQYESEYTKYQAMEAQYQKDLEQYNADVAVYGEAAMEGEKAKLDRTRAQLDALTAQLAQAKAQLDASKAQLDNVRSTLDETKQQLATWAKALEEGQAQYDAGVGQLAAAKSQIDAAAAKISQTEKTLSAGESQYASGLQKLERGKADYRKAKAEADTKFADAKAELGDVKEKLDDAKKEIDSIKKPTVYVLNRYTNVGYASFESDSDIVDGIAKIFPIFFFLVAALVCVTTMSRMVDEQRTQIGTLKSLGYTPREIAGGYLLYSGLASGLGSAMGVWLGSFVFPKVIWQAYNIMYGFGEIDFVFDWGFSAIVCSVFVFSSLLVTLLSCKKELADVPAALIRPQSPKAGKRIFLEYIPFLWNRFGFLEKVSARNIFRYKKRMFMMIIGIAGCTALLITGFGLNDSISGLANTQFETISIYDTQVSFRDPMSQSEQADFLESYHDSVASCAFLSVSTVDAQAGNHTKSVNLVGTDETDLSSFVNFELDGAAQHLPGPGEALIDNGLAKTLGVNVGDTIILRNADMRELKVTVSGTYRNIIHSYVYVSGDTLREAGGFSASVNTAYINFEEGADPYASAAAMGFSPYVMTITVNEESRSMINHSLDSMKYIVALITFCAGALAFIVLYNLTNINIGERLREIATIKVLGFRRWETASYVYRENLALTVMGALAGIPLGIWLHGYVMNNIHVDMLTFDAQINLPSYLIAFAATLLFAVVVDFFMYFRLDRINMAESLKAVE
jgi:putative ABC transport system permease protein